MIEHNGADAGYRSYAGRFPDHGLAIAIACNASTANTTALARGVADVYLAKVLAPVPAASTAALKPVTLQPGALERRAGSYVQPTTRQVVQLTVRGGQLMLGRYGGPVLVPTAENRFRIQGQAQEYVFAEGEHAGFELRPLAGGRAVPFEWRAPVVASAAALPGYSGDYFSEELNARYRVTANDSTIVLRTGTSDPMTVLPAFADSFVGEGWTIQFVRRKGLVSGFEATDGRVRRVAFEKVDAKK